MARNVLFIVNTTIAAFNMESNFSWKNVSFWTGSSLKNVVNSSKLTTVCRTEFPFLKKNSYGCFFSYSSIKHTWNSQSDFTYLLEISTLKSYNFDWELTGHLLLRLTWFFKKENKEGSKSWKVKKTNLSHVTDFFYESKGRTRTFRTITVQYQLKSLGLCWTDGI